MSRQLKASAFTPTKVTSLWPSIKKGAPPGVCESVSRKTLPPELRSALPINVTAVSLPCELILMSRLSRKKPPIALSMSTGVCPKSTNQFRSTDAPSDAMPEPRSDKKQLPRVTAPGSN